MRPIKFRGMSVNGHWYYGMVSVVTCKQHPGPGSYIANSVGMPFAYQVRPETVGQFIYLTDCKGKDIYEGDILDCIYMREGCKHKFQIIFDTDAACFRPISIGRCLQSSVRQNMHDMKRSTIIGNIHENPELLEVKDAK